MMDDYQVRVPRSPEEERAYLLRRRADHVALAAGTGEPENRALHERFAALYAARAEALLVDQDQPAMTKIPGTNPA